MYPMSYRSILRSAVHWLHQLDIKLIHPIISSQLISIPIADGWIPRVDSRTSYFQTPPQHELRQPIPPSPSSVATKVQDSRPTQQSEPTPASPHVRWLDYVDRMSVSPYSTHGDTPSIASRASTHISHEDPVNERPGSSLRVGQGRSGSQPSRESTSRNEHRDQDRQQDSRTEAGNNTAQRAVENDTSPPRNPPHSFMPFPYQPPGFYYPRAGPDDRARNNRQSRWVVPTESAGTTPWAPPNDTTSRSAIVIPVPPGGVYDPQLRRVVQTESAAVASQPPRYDPAFLLEHLHRQFNQPRRGSTSGTLDVIVESPVSTPHIPTLVRHAY
ncbi:hypothetical protein OG21DRAFT_419111 [Imleria badia]|nr:hypothetical protein OG21DRAFT_419111 [Imleria badia]